jgi:hypothetical protein
VLSEVEEIADRVGHIRRGVVVEGLKWSPASPGALQPQSGGQGVAGVMLRQMSKETP